MSNKKILVVLVSNGVSDLTQASNQRYTKNILRSKKLPYVEVDGMNPEHHERLVHLRWIPHVGWYAALVHMKTNRTPHLFNIPAVKSYFQ